MVCRKTDWGALLLSLAELPGGHWATPPSSDQKQGPEKICPENVVSKLGTLENKTESKQLWQLTRL